MTSSHVIMLLCVLHACVPYTGSKEYCQLEGFDATCPPGHVILVTKAKYGRMRLGRCLTRDYYVGCSDDVTNILHERCSGKTACYVSLPDPALYEKQHCPKDLVSYLDAEYSCLQVTHFPNTSCTNNHRELFISQDGGFLAGYQPFSSAYQTPTRVRCPLVLRAPRGQRINITLYEFFTMADPALINGYSDGQQYQCTVLATVRESIGQSTTENVICARGGHRQELVYSSKSDRVVLEIHQLRGQEGSHKHRFLIQYQAIGCRDPDIPEDMTQQRRGDQLDVRCNNTGQVWHLVCRGNSWVGEFGNCTTEAGGIYYDGGGARRGIGFPNGIVMAIVVGIVLGIMIGFCLLLVVYNVRRKRKKNTSARASGAQLAGKYPDGAYSVHDPMLPPSHPDLTVDKGCHVMCDVSGGTLARGRDHVYEKPQSGMEVQCLLGQVKPTEAAILTLEGVQSADYGCHIHRKQTWPAQAQKIEMITPSCMAQT